MLGQQIVCLQDIASFLAAACPRLHELHLSVYLQFVGPTLASIPGMLLPMPFHEQDVHRLYKFHQLA